MPPTNTEYIEGFLDFAMSTRGWSASGSMPLGDFRRALSLFAKRNMRGVTDIECRRAGLSPSTSRMVGVSALLGGMKVLEKEAPTLDTMMHVRRATH